MIKPIPPEDRKRALEVLASEGRMMRAEPQDIVALLDFMEDPRNTWLRRPSLRRTKVPYQPS